MKRTTKLKHLRYIGIDEIAIAKGHRYLTVVMDLESGAVVFVANGKGADALKPFWKRLRTERGQNRGGGHGHVRGLPRSGLTDMPRAKIVCDRFRVIKLFNDKLSELRRELYREATDMLQKKVSRERRGYC